MEDNKEKNIKMEINDTKYEGEWTISNFLLTLKDGCNSPCFFCDSFQVKLIINNNNGLEISLKFIPLCNNNMNIDYSIKIINIDDQKSEKIDGNETLDGTEKECKIYSKIPLQDINTENGYLQNESLRITCSFQLNKNPSSSPIQCDISKEAEYITDWYINENIGDFHSTEEPIELKIKDTPIQFAITFEITENDTFLFTLLLIDPTISFNGQLTVILHNQISPERSITKQSYISFTPEEYDIQPFLFDLSSGQLSDQKNGWMAYDQQTNDLRSGLHFTIKFDPPEKILNRFSQFKIETEKKLFDKYPPNLSTNEQVKVYNFDITFMKKQYNFNKPYTCQAVQMGGIILNATVDFAAEKITFHILDSVFPEGRINFMVVFENSHIQDVVPVLKKTRYSKTKRDISLDLPFSISDLLDYSKGWIVNDSFEVNCGVKVEELNVTSLYPIKLSNTVNNGFYGIKYFIPLSLFSMDGQQFTPYGRDDQILFNPFYTKCLSVTPELTFIRPFAYEIDWLNFKLNAKTSLQFKYYKQDVVFDILVTFVNIDKDKNVQMFFPGVSGPSLDLPDFNLNKPLKEEGFQHIYDSKEVIEMDIKIHIYNDNYNDFSESEEREKILDLCKEKHNSRRALGYSAIAIEDGMKFDYPVENEPINSSKNDTGYVGLCNQGATCYLNSYMQTLFHLPAFRKIIYGMHTTENDDPNTSIPLNIQQLFYQLESEEKPCSTVNLTKSFGWNSYESFQQHDIEEFSRVLIDNLEKKLKGTKLEDSISHLFKGRFRNYIKCKDVDYTSYKEESFYDLSMDVKGIPNLCESFKNYIKPDELTGPNQYNTEKFGKQDAIMGTEFLEFPPILHIHLRRFMFDITSIQGMTKINDRFEFPETIDLTEYLSDDSPQKKESNVYDLYGVLVHSGGFSGGHYYAFLRTSTDKQWYKFNDSFVSKDTVEKAVYDNYGAKDRSYSGYMIIYVRRKDAESLYEPLSEDLLPDHLKKPKKEEHNLEKNILVHFIHEDYLKLNAANKILQFFRNEGIENNEVHVEEYEKSTTTAELYLLLGSLYCLDPSQLRLWICFKNKVSRKVILYSEETTLDMITKGRNDLYVLVQPIKENEEFDFRKQIMIYVDFFFSQSLLDKQELEDDTILKKQKSAPLQYLSSFALPNNAKISSVVPSIIKKLGFSKDAKFNSYLGMSNGTIRQISINGKFNDNEYGNGLILIFEMKQESIDQIPNGSLKLDFEFQSPTENSVQKNSSVKLYSYDKIDDDEDTHIEEIIFQSIILEVYNIADRSVPLFDIKLPNNTDYYDARRIIVEAAKKNENIDQDVDEEEVSLFYFDCFDLHDLLYEVSINQDISRIYILVQSHELKQTEITVQFSIDAKTVAVEKVVPLEGCMNFDDVFNRFKSSFDEEEKKKLFPDDKVLRYLIIQDGSIEKVIDDYTFLTDLKDNEILRAEIVPQDHLDEIKALLFRTVYSDPESSTKTSFLFQIQLDEKFLDTKKRLLDYLGLKTSIENLNFYLYIKGETFSYNTLKAFDSKHIIHEYSVLKKNDDGIIKLCNSSTISDFINFGFYLLQIVIVNDKFDELKKEFDDNTNMKKISVESYEFKDENANANFQDLYQKPRNNTDLRIYN